MGLSNESEPCLTRSEHDLSLGQSLREGQNRKIQGSCQTNRGSATHAVSLSI